MSRLRKHLAPIESDKSLLLADISSKYEEMDTNMKKVSSALNEISESTLLSEKTKETLKKLLYESDKSNENFRKDIRNKRRSERKKRKRLFINTEPDTPIKDIQSAVTLVQEKRKLSPEDLMYEMNSNKILDKDYQLNESLSEMDKLAIFKKIIKFNNSIRRYRSFYGNNPLKWTPQERITVSNIYDYMANEYKILHHEEGYEYYSMIAKNLRDNPLNKLRKFTPSAPRGSSSTTLGPNKFKVFVDGD